MILFEWSDSLPVSQVHAECVDAFIILPTCCISIVAHAYHIVTSLVSSNCFSSFFAESFKVSVFHFVDINEFIIWPNNQTVIIEFK